MTDEAIQAARLFKEKFPNTKPSLAILLGSGLGSLADCIDRPRVLSYEVLPGFHQPTVLGHTGQLMVGELEGQVVLCLQGRAHLYEGASLAQIQTMVRTCQLVGCTTLVVTNAAGSLHASVGVGHLVLVKDHINFQSSNPLVGINDERFGPRFISMENTYDAALRARVLQMADQLGIALSEGVYLGVLGPSFETPAEINAFRILGADLVGMSTVPEVIVARHCGLRILALSVVTNLAAGLSSVPITHEETLRGAQLGSAKMIQLVRHFIRHYE